MTMQPDELKALRKASAMTQQHLADAIGMSRKQIVEMEAGRAPIEKRTAHAALYAMGWHGTQIWPPKSRPIVLWDGSPMEVQWQENGHEGAGYYRLNGEGRVRRAHLFHEIFEAERAEDYSDLVEPEVSL